MDARGNSIEKEGIYEINVIFMNYLSHISLEDKPYSFRVNTTPIDYKKCDRLTSFGKYANDFESAPRIEDLFCINSDSKNFTIYGKYSDTENGFSYLNFYVNKCENNTELNKTCKTEAEINKKLSNSYFGLIFLDNQINHNNSTQTNRHVKKITSMSMSTNLHKRYYYYIKQVIYTTDFGYFFPENVEETFYQQEHYEVDMKLPSETNHLSNFGTVTIINDNKIDIYHRSYDKFQLVMANIGGLMEGIMMCATIINYIFTRNYSLLKIINTIFDTEIR